MLMGNVACGDTMTLKFKNQPFKPEGEAIKAIKHRLYEEKYFTRFAITNATQRQANTLHNQAD